MAKELILIVEDEARIADVLERYLKAEHYRVERASDGKQALSLWRSAKPDAILLDVMLPEVDGLDIVRRIRREADVPILMVTAKVEEYDRLLGLELGADDYISKPFSPREVVARLKAVLRRSSGQLQSPQHFHVGALRVDLEAVEAYCQDSVLQLSPTQLRLLATLAAQPQRAFTRNELLEALREGFVDERTVDAHIKNLRRRLGDCSAQLETVRGYGYRLRADSPSAPDNES